nr:hypothetical protein BEI47_17170 [Aliivibrio fischeri]
MNKSRDYKNSVRACSKTQRAPILKKYQVSAFLLTLEHVSLQTLLKPRITLLSYTGLNTLIHIVRMDVVTALQLK